MNTFIFYSIDKIVEKVATRPTAKQQKNTHYLPPHKIKKHEKSGFPGFSVVITSVTRIAVKKFLSTGAAYPGQRERKACGTQGRKRFCKHGLMHDGKETSPEGSLKCFVHQSAHKTFFAPAPRKPFAPFGRGKPLLWTRIFWPQSVRPLSSYRFSISTLSNRSSASSSAMSPLSSVAVFAADMAAALFNAV